MGSCQAVPFPCPHCQPLLPSQSFLLSSTNTLSQNTNKTNLLAAPSSRSTAHPKGRLSRQWVSPPSSREQPEPAALTAGEDLLPAGLGQHPQLCPCHSAPGAPHTSASSLKQEKGPDLKHSSGILSCIPRWDTRPPASSLLRTPLRDQRLSTVTSSRCPSVPAETADAVPLMRGTIPSTSCPAMAQELPHFSQLGEEGPQPRSCPSIKTRDTRVGSTSLAGWAALSFPGCQHAG